MGSQPAGAMTRALAGRRDHHLATWKIIGAITIDRAAKHRLVGTMIKSLIRPLWKTEERDAIQYKMILLRSVEIRNKKYRRRQKMSKSNNF